MIKPKQQTRINWIRTSQRQSVWVTLIAIHMIPRDSHILLIPPHKYRNRPDIHSLTHLLPVFLRAQCWAITSRPVILKVVKSHIHINNRSAFPRIFEISLWTGYFSLRKGVNGRRAGRNWFVGRLDQLSGGKSTLIRGILFTGSCLHFKIKCREIAHCVGPLKTPMR